VLALQADGYGSGLDVAELVDELMQPLACPQSGALTLSVDDR
jgi:hypothetical protein